MLLEEIMGKEYAESFPGQMYFAFEKIQKECSVSKFKMLAKEIVNLVPATTRDRLGYTTVYYNSFPVRRDEKEEAWLDMPEFTSASIHHITAQIMYVAPKSGKDLIKLWQADPRQFAWQIINVMKLISIAYGDQGLKSGWH